MLNNLIDSLDDNSNTELLAMSRQINMLSNNIFEPKNSTSGLKKKRNLLRNGSQEHQKRHDTLSFPLRTKQGDEKV